MRSEYLKERYVDMLDVYWFKKGSLTVDKNLFYLKCTSLLSHTSVLVISWSVNILSQARVFVLGL